MQDQFESELIAVLPRLRATAMMFTRDRAAADDLLQEAAVLALTAKSSYVLDTNMFAWMYRLMRNRFISLMRRRRHGTVSLDDPAALAVGAPGGQENRIIGLEVQRELGTLPAAMREALVLSASGLSYTEVASALDCTVDTVKCRISRARAKMRERFAADPAPVGAANGAPAVAAGTAQQAQAPTAG